MRGVQDAEPLGLRERKLRETRHALESATVDLVLELGLEQVTIEQIAERADVSPRTFFNYFGSKEDALLGVGVRQTESQLLAGFPQQPSSNGVYHDLRQFLIDHIGRRFASDRLLQKRMAAIESSPQLARRQLAQMHLLLDGLTTRVAALLGAERGLPAADLAQEAQMLIRLCSIAFMQAFDPRRPDGPAAGHPTTLPEAFALLERTARTHLPPTPTDERQPNPAPRKRAQP